MLNIINTFYFVGHLCWFMFGVQTYSTVNSAPQRIFMILAQLSVVFWALCGLYVLWVNGSHLWERLVQPHWIACHRLQLFWRHTRALYARVSSWTCRERALIGWCPALEMTSWGKYKSSLFSRQVVLTMVIRFKSVHDQRHDLSTQSFQMTHNKN